jgi:DNA-binding transcriptional MocR family regulator
MAARLGLNRTTVSAAYEILDQAGLIQGSVGRGSFVSGPSQSQAPEIEWSRVLRPSFASPIGAPREGAINFSASRPSECLFPVEEFRAGCEEVLADPRLRSLLQLGSPAGYEPLREYLLAHSGICTENDSILITNGCQQAADLLRRALVRPGDRVGMEEPVYPGLKNLFLEAGAELIGIRIGESGAEIDGIARALHAGAKTIVLTPSFQNPTGATIPAENRRSIIALARKHGAVIIENDMYSGLAYEPVDAPRLKSLDADVILVGSFSKIAFPGLRCGWVIAPRPVIARLTELKQMADLHTDQLSQAFLLRFAESSRLAAHSARMIEAGRERIRALSEACRRFLRGCRFQIPSGGMNMWIELPDGLDAVALRGLAQRAGVDYLPGRYFSISRPLDSGLRISFAGPTPEEIRRGIRILGETIAEATETQPDAPAAALALV